MDEELEFKHIMAGPNSGGTDKNMILMPYAKNLEYKNGELSMMLELFNDSVESNVGITIKLSGDIIDLLDRMIYGEEW